MTIESTFEGIRAGIVRDLEAVGGRHDEPEIYAGDPGDPGLAGGPGSISWEINGDLASVGAAGMAAVIMEVLEPSVMAGVDAGTYRVVPERRARNTLGYVLRTTFGTTAAATKVIEQVKGVHARIEGIRPDGVPFRALDPVLFAWVHTCIPWAIMTAFERTNRPLAPAEKDRYLAEQAAIGRMGGADDVPESVADLEAFVAEMRPRLALSGQTVEFIDFLCGETGDESRATPREQFERRLIVHSSMTLMPAWARRLTGTDHPDTVTRLVHEPFLQLQARLVRWAVPELPCHRMALERCGVVEPAAAVPVGAPA